MFARQIDLFADRCADRCADRYTLSKIKYAQNIAYAHFRGYRPVVQDLASILLVLARWDYTRVCEFQDALADLVSSICKPIHPTTKEPISYSGRQIRGALKTLEDAGYLSIPRTVSREEKLAKTYRMNPSFISIVKTSPIKIVPDEDMCDNSILRRPPAMSDHSRADKAPEIPKSGFIPQSRAVECSARDDRNIYMDDAEPKRAVYSRSVLRRDLPSAYRQIVHWIAGCNMLTGQREAITLCGEFLSRANDGGQVAYWVEKWPEMTKSERAFAVRQLIGVLRAFPSAIGLDPAHCQSIADVAPASPEPGTPMLFPPNVDRFRAALFFHEPYEGPGQKFVEKFRSADTDTQDLMLADLQIAVKNGKFVD